MWCDQCRAEVSTSHSPVTGLEQCTECGQELGSSEPVTNQTIAQTAQALLKRWEESRLDEPAETVDAADDDLTDQFERAYDSSESLLKEQPEEPARPEPKRTSPVMKMPSRPTPAPPTPAPKAENVERPSVPTPQSRPARLELPNVEQPRAERPAPSMPQAAPKMERRPEQPAPRPQQQEPARPARSEASEPPRRSFSKPEPQKNPPAPTAPAPRAARNDAAALMNREPMNRETQNREPQKPVASIPVGDALRDEAPASRATSPVSSTPERPTTEPRREGQVKMSAPAYEAPSFALPEKSTRPGRNWSAIFGQTLVLLGGLGMTAGVGIVIACKFGNVAQLTESTGWLTFAGCQLMFVFGIYTNLSSRMEQVLVEMHRRCDDLSTIIAQQQTVIRAASPRPETPRPESEHRFSASKRAGSFDRSSTDELVQSLPR
ncbi:hypothetical protein [Rubinisphaera margarita]|uniref:hypothetical protein n=1 Tax=Rubinisphaera margarita TaxID=2909586 RepID=UPI001EE8D4E1|nr:hypothetical protein [Rubinisphaera margarita]MCG6156929.1 hypothetical protein [Rubinisphaera margarita]